MRTLCKCFADERFTLINENFRFIKRFLRFYGLKSVDGILADWEFPLINLMLQRGFLLDLMLN
jgi:16S rRNA C1402 N4-methylase RsmH